MKHKKENRYVRSRRDKRDQQYNLNPFFMVLLSIAAP